MCPNPNGKGDSTSKDEEAHTEPKTACTVTISDTESVRVNISPGGKSLLPVLPVSVRIPGCNETIEANALLDCGCDGTLIASHLKDRLGCNVKKKVKLRINHACGSKIVEAEKISALQIKGVGQFSSWHLIKEIECLPELPTHGNPIGYQKIDKKRFSYLDDVDIPSFR